MPSQIKKLNVQYPMQLGNDRTFLRSEEPIVSRLRLLIDCRQGDRPRYPNYGVNLDQLEQQSKDLQVLLPMILLQLQDSIARYLTGASIRSITLDKKPIGGSRSVDFSVSVTKLVNGAPIVADVTTHITV